MQRARSVAYFIGAAVVLALPAAVAISISGKLELHAAINSLHAPWADAFFRYITHGADGLVPTALALALLVVKDLRSFLMMGLGCGISAIIAQVLKRTVFPEMNRPGLFRAELGDMHWVADLELNHHFSFPSGHATAAFSMCLALAVISGKPRWAVPLALVACVLAFSRVYLSQHFTQDVLAGAAIGTLGSVLVYVWLYRSKFAQRTWLTRSLGQPPK